MTTFLIILCALLWAGALLLLFRRPLYSPALSFLGLLALSFCSRQGLPLLPLNSTILYGWLSICIVVILATLMQPDAIRNDARGVGYMLGGSLAGLAVGLLAYTFTPAIQMLYSIMIVAVAAGLFFGFLLYVNTPQGRSLAPASGHFFRYLLAKGFPTAISVMMMGILCVLLIARQTSTL